jgi:hypothetical protein
VGSCTRKVGLFRLRSVFVPGSFGQFLGSFIDEDLLFRVTCWLRSGYFALSANFRKRRMHGCESLRLSWPSMLPRPRLVAMRGWLILQEKKVVTEAAAKLFWRFRACHNCGGVL